MVRLIRPAGAPVSRTVSWDAGTNATLQRRLRRLAPAPPQLALASDKTYWHGSSFFRKTTATNHHYHHFRCMRNSA